MLVTNLTAQDYWFGPLHLLGGNGQTLTVDDTSATSLYLTDDGVADAVNTLAASNKIQVTGAATPFPRPTGTPQVLHADGSPEGLVYAGQGSLFLRRDSGSLYTKKTGIHLNTGWNSIAQGSITTTSPLSGGPPTSPNDGDIWIATDVNANGDGSRWQFQFNATSASSYKWEFIGGSPLRSEITTSQGANFSGSWGDLGTVGPTVTLPRNGDYRLRYMAQASLGGFVDAVFAGLALGATTPTFTVELSAQGNGVAPLFDEVVWTGRSSGDVVRMRYNGGIQVDNFSNRRIYVEPVRIS
jgi:hypothetical protein